MYKHQYCLHGVPVQVTTDDPEISEAAQTLLSSFEDVSAAPEQSLRLNFHQVASPDLLPETSPAAELLSSQERPSDPDDAIQGWSVYRDGDGILVDFYKQGVLRFDALHENLLGYLARPETPQMDIRVNLIHFSLVEMVKRHGLYTVHAAGLEKNGHGILIPAFSGKGKTTACISLVRSGYRCLADDHPFVRQHNGAVELLSFPEHVDVTDQTVSFFPELARAGDALQDGLYKRKFDVHAVYPHTPVDACRASLIVFPRVIEFATSYLEPLSKSRALEELMPHGFRVLDKDVARRHFQVLARLVDQADCYRLLYGEDVLDLPRLIDPLVAR